MSVLLRRRGVDTRHTCHVNTVGECDVPTSQGTPRTAGNQPPRAVDAAPPLGADPARAMTGDPESNTRWGWVPGDSRYVWPRAWSHGSGRLC